MMNKCFIFFISINLENLYFGELQRPSNQRQEPCDITLQYNKCSMNWLRFVKWQASKGCTFSWKPYSDIQSIQWYPISHHTVISYHLNLFSGILSPTTQWYHIFWIYQWYHISHHPVISYLLNLFIGILSPIVQWYHIIWIYSVISYLPPHSDIIFSESI